MKNFPLFKRALLKINNKEVEITSISALQEYMEKQ